MICISTDNIDSIVPWANQIGISFPMGSDFWPHGHVALDYGVMRGEGVADRGVFLVDKDGIIRFREVYSVHKLPPTEPVLEALKLLPR